MNPREQYIQYLIAQGIPEFEATRRAENPFEVQTWYSNTMGYQDPYAPYQPPRLQNTGSDIMPIPPLPENNLKPPIEQQPSTPQDRGRFLDNLTRDPFLYTGYDIPSAATQIGLGLGFSQFRKNNEGFNPTSRQRLGNTLRTGSAIAKTALGLARNVFSGLAFQNRYLNTMQDYQTKMQEDYYPYYYEDGGEQPLSTQEFLTGEFRTDEPNPNAIVEKGEYTKTIDGQIRKVVGDTHEGGGVFVNLEPMERVISDNQKIGGSSAAMFRKEFDLNVKAKNTWADVIDKWNKVNKLYKINKEQEKLFEKLEEQQDVEQNTARVNANFLANKIYEKEVEKAPILAEREKFTDFVFYLQEVKKLQDEKSKSTPTETTTKSKTRTEKKRGKIEIRQNSLNIPQHIFENGGTNPPFVLLNPYAQSAYGSQSQYGAAYGSINETIPDRSMFYSQVSSPLYQQFFTTDELGNAVPVYDRVGEFQKAYNTYLTEMGGFLKEKGYSDREINQYIESQMFDSTPDSVRGFDSKFGEYTSSRGGFVLPTFDEQTINKLQNLGIYTARQLSDNRDKIDFLTDDEITSVTGGLSALQYGDYKLGVIQQPPQEQQIPEYGTDRSIEGVVVEVSPDVPIGVPIPPKVDTSQYKAPPPPQQEGRKTVTQNEEQVRPPIMLPDQSVLPPDSLSPAFKQRARFGRVEAQQISPTEALTEIDRQAAVIQSKINNLPDAQKRAALASLAATTQESATKAIVQSNLINQQARQQAENINIAIANRERELNENVYPLSFEERQLRAKDITDQNIRNWFNFNRAVRLSNFENVRNQNLIDSLYPNFTQNPDGSISLDVNGQEMKFTNEEQARNYLLVMAAQNQR